MRKNLSVFVLLCLLLSCKNEEKKPTENETPTKAENKIKVLPPATHYTVPDHSPMDMVYFPNDYPLLKMAGKTNAPPLLRIIYSRPQKENRKIFDGLIKYDVPWRLGANEATEIEFFSPAKIQNKTIKPGRYIIYCVPQETKWTLVFNSNLYSWGLQQNRQMDLMQFEIPVERNQLIIEYFTIACEKKSDRSVDILFLWEEVKTRLAVSF
jgi:hypothetical protein